MLFVSLLLPQLLGDRSTSLSITAVDLTDCHVSTSIKFLSYCLLLVVRLS